MNIWTDAELKLCRRLHELNVRPEIREGDWVFWTDKIITLIKSKATLADAIEHRNEAILLWSWSRCREWLRMRGWLIRPVHGLCDQWDGKNSVTFFNDKDLLGEGQTDLEAILAVMVQVVEEGKSESE